MFWTTDCFWSMIPVSCSLQKPFLPLERIFSQQPEFIPSEPVVCQVLASTPTFQLSCELKQCSYSGAWVGCVSLYAVHNKLSLSYSSSIEVLLWPTHPELVVLVRGPSQSLSALSTQRKLDNIAYWFISIPLSKHKKQQILTKFFFNLLRPKAWRQVMKYLRFHFPIYTRHHCSIGLSFLDSVKISRYCTL